MREIKVFLKKCFHDKKKKKSDFLFYTQTNQCSGIIILIT